jgi:hypothetical protein
MAFITYISLGSVKVGADGSWQPNFGLIAYYIVCILLTVNVYKYLSGRGQNIAAMALIPLLFLVFIFFGIRWNWFLEKKPASSKSNDNAGCTSDNSIKSPSIEFPPIVNMCPDFMVAWQNPSDRIVYCYDANNTYNMKTGAGTPPAGMVKISINGKNDQFAYVLHDPSSNTAAKNPSEDATGSRWPLYALIKSNFATISNDPKGKYMRWEGVIQSTGNRYDFWQYNLMRVLPGISGNLPSTSS